MLALACAVYLVAGSIGHDPWKADDATHLGIAHDIVLGGSWLVPHIAGETWNGATPVFHWLAALVAQLTQWLLPFHDGARLATPLFGALFLYLLYGAAKGLHGRDDGMAAPVLAMGTLGLLVPIHDAQPAIAALAASAAAYYGLARLSERPIVAALLLGAGTGGAFLAGGLAWLLPLLPLLLLPLIQRRWLAAFVAIYCAISVASLWPTLLALRYPTHLVAWWQDELAAAAPHAMAFSRNHLELLAWSAWPVLPLATWAGWVVRKQWREWRFLVPLVGTLWSLAWLFAHEARPLAVLPTLPPLLLLAAAGAGKLRRGAANAFDWFGMTTFTLAIGLVWLGGIALWTGWPPQIAHNFAKLQPGFDGQFSVVALAAALMFSALWIAALAKLPRSPWRAAIRWSAGLAALWGTLVALWFPWIDYGKSYRGVALALNRALPSHHGCVEGRGIGPAQRAALDYFIGLRAQSASKGCRWLLVIGPAAANAPVADWRKTWEGQRPGDKGERWRLYRRAD